MLHCANIDVSFGTTRALRDVTLTAATGSIVAIMGESGSGKSTLLRVIAGLVAPDAGRVTWDGVDMTDTPTHLRGFGLMFQDYALFPHLSVADNVEFGLRMQGAGEVEQRRVAQRVLQLVGLAGYGERRVEELSGGEQQRVALARTLAPEPRLILLDEPLGALDRARRDQLLADIQRIFAERGVTALYVTHDHQEAFAVADAVGVLHEGRLIATGTPQDLWAEPGHDAVATMLGFPVLRDVAVSNQRLPLGGSEVAVDLPDGRYDLAMAPGALRVSAEGDVHVTVLARRFEGGDSRAVIDLDGRELIAEAPPGIALGPSKAVIDGSKILRVGS